jgi:hypothetical protein
VLVNDLPLTTAISGSEHTHRARMIVNSCFFIVRNIILIYRLLLLVSRRKYKELILKFQVFVDKNIAARSCCLTSKKTSPLQGGDDILDELG